MSGANELRRLALQKHRAVTRKVSRIKATTGAEVSGSDQDPRTELAFIRNASEGELRALVRKQDKFLARSTQFVPDADLKPLPKSLWQKYEAAEAKKNAAELKTYQEFKDVEIGPSGMTVDQRMAAITPLHAHMGQHTTPNPYRSNKRASTSVYGVNGLKRLIDHTRKLATQKHQKEALDNHRAGVMKMLDSIGDEQLSQKLNSLTTKQWAYLWKYTPFAANIKPTYEHYKDAIDARDSVMNSQMIQTDLAVAGEYVDDASKKFKKKR
jgi:hypothetical protein